MFFIIRLLIWLLPVSYKRLTGTPQSIHCTCCIHVASMLQISYICLVYVLITDYRHWIFPGEPVSSLGCYNVGRQYKLIIEVMPRVRFSVSHLLFEIASLSILSKTAPAIHLTFRYDLSIRCIDLWYLDWLDWLRLWITELLFTVLHCLLAVPHSIFKIFKINVFS